MMGLTTRLANGSIPVLRLHYAADPDKRPGTEAGDRWRSEASSGYPGGIKSARWRKEMEIEYGALGGTKVFPDWETWLTEGTLIIPPFEPVGYALYGSYDHGWRHPAAYHVHGVGTDGRIVTLWETYGERITIQEMSRIITGQAVLTSDGRHFPGNPYAGLELYKVADPQLWAEDQQASDNTMKSTATLFESCEEPVFFEPGERGGDTTIVEWLLGEFWRDPHDPRYRITTACPKLIWELGKLRHREYSARVALNREQPEQLVDKDNHAWDGLKMFLKRFPPSASSPKPEKAPGSFEWWRKQAKAVTEGGVARTYRREMVGG